MMIVRIRFVVFAMLLASPALGAAQEPAQAAPIWVAAARMAVDTIRGLDSFVGNNPIAVVVDAGAVGSPTVRRPVDPATLQRTFAAREGLRSGPQSDFLKCESNAQGAVSECWMSPTFAPHIPLITLRASCIDETPCEDRLWVNVSVVGEERGATRERVPISRVWRVELSRGEEGWRIETAFLWIQTEERDRSREGARF